MAAISSNGTGGGNWGTTTTWAGGVVPVEGDSVTIVSGDTVTVDGTYTAGDDSATAITVNGTLKAHRTTTNALTVKGTITITGANAVLDYGTSASPVTGSATMILNYSATLADSKYGLYVNYDAACYMFGAARTVNTYLTANVAAAATSFDVADATGWVVGDTVIIGQTDGNAHDEIRTITSITPGSGTAATIGCSALSYAHDTVANSLKATPVSNFSSTVTFKGYNDYSSYVGINASNSSAVGSREVQYVNFQSINNYASNPNASIIASNSGTTTLAWTAFKHASFNDYSGSGGIVFGVFGDWENIAFEDIGVYATNSHNAYYTYQGAQCSFTNCVAYHCAGWWGSGYSQGGVGVSFTDCKFWTSSNGLTVSPVIGGTFKNCAFHSIIVTNNAYLGLNFGGVMSFTDCDFGSSNLPGTPAAYFLVTSTSGGLCPATFTDCYFSSSLVSYMAPNFANANTNNYVVLANIDVDPTKQNIFYPQGTFFRDNTTYKTGVASLRAEPTSATTPLSVQFQIFAPSGSPIAVSGFLRKNTSYGSTNLPYVTLSGLGIAVSTYTMTDTNDTWEQFIVNGTQTTGTDGILLLTFYFQSAGTGAQAWVDGISAPAPAAVNSGDFGFWQGGQPVPLIAANYTSARDVWNTLATNVTLTGSMGELVQTASNKIDDNQALIIAK